jgi:hypothetical protein
MIYMLTEVYDVTNTGADTEVLEFDTFNELQDHIETVTSGMSDDDRELYMYYARVEEL